MQTLINDLCRNKNIDLGAMLELCASRGDHELASVLNYANPTTGDNVIIYAVRSGNLNLIRLLNETSEFRFNMAFTNHDGKNVLHEVLYSNSFHCRHQQTKIE